MNALRNSKKISLLAVAILFLFTFFNLILNAPRTIEQHQASSGVNKNRADKLTH
jgi:hypothetical protein